MLLQLQGWEGVGGCATEGLHPAQPSACLRAWLGSLSGWRCDACLVLQAEEPREGAEMHPPKEKRHRKEKKEKVRARVPAWPSHPTQCRRVPPAHPVWLETGCNL